MKKKIIGTIVTIIFVLGTILLIQYGFKIPILDLFKAIIQGIKL